MRIVVSAVVVFALGAVVDSHPASSRRNWYVAARLAEPSLTACAKLGADAGVFGVVRYQRDSQYRLSVVGSPSLGAARDKLERCVQRALEQALAQAPDDEDAPEQSDTLAIGKPAVIMPAAATLMPLWWRAMSSSGTAAFDARAKLASILPREYTLTLDNCFRTKWESARQAEPLWLQTVGTMVPAMWNSAVGSRLGYGYNFAVWDPTAAGGQAAFVTASDRGLCLTPFDAQRQTDLRADFDRFGSCWTGSFTEIMLHPRIGFPTDRMYTQIAVSSGRACALTTTGEVTCCGMSSQPLPEAPSGLRSVAVGYGFACGLDAQHHATCWGAIAKPPTGTFTKVVADQTAACGLRGDGRVECWGRLNQNTTSPTGTFVELVENRCGRRQDGSVECWDSKGPALPTGFTTIAVDASHGCGLRRDHTLGCWRRNDTTVDTPTPDKLHQVAVGTSYDVCALRDDGTPWCWTPIPRSSLTPPPATPIVQLASDRDMYCGLRDDAKIECWGDVWPGRSQKAIPYVAQVVPTSTIRGRVTDDLGAPLANAEVLACTAANAATCTAIANEAHRKPDPLAQIAAGLGLDANKYRVVTTGADGTWTLDHGTAADRMTVLVTGVDRELVMRLDARYTAEPSWSTVALRPASTLDLVATCDGAACAGKLSVAMSRTERREGTHVERLAPGTYAAELHEAIEKRESIGTALVDVGFTTKALRLPIELRSPKP